jgi:hypothetical protein
LEQLKKANDKVIFKKKSGRYAVKDCTTKQWINGDAKTEILLAEGLIKLAEPKPAEAAAEATAEASPEA